MLNDGTTVTRIVGVREHVQASIIKLADRDLDTLLVSAISYVNDDGLKPYILRDEVGIVVVILTNLILEYGEVEEVSRYVGLNNAISEEESFSIILNKRNDHLELVRYRSRVVVEAQEGLAMITIITNLMVRIVRLQHIVNFSIRYGVVNIRRTRGTTMDDTIQKSTMELKKGYCKSSPYIRNDLIDVSTECLGTGNNTDVGNLTEQRRCEYQVVRPLNICRVNFLTTMGEVLSDEHAVITVARLPTRE